MSPTHRNTKTLSIRPSPIQGYGVFANRDIHKGEMITLMRGTILTVPEVQKLYLNGQTRTTCDTLQIAEQKYVLLDPLHNSINHSCNPNAGMRKIRSLVALRNIRKGEEVTFDYSIVEWTPRNYTAYDPHDWPLRCDCHSPRCRKLIKCFPYVPKALQNKYVRSGMIQDFILRKLASPRNETRCDVCENMKE